MADIYPPSYFEARDKFSNKLLHIFDQQLEEHRHISLTPTDTVQGHIYLAVSIAMLGLPQLALWASNTKNYNIRHALYQNLVDITQDQYRIALSNQSSCIEALQKKTIAFTDLAHCPIKLLLILLLPDFQTYLIEDMKQISEKRDELYAQINQSKTETQKIALGNQRSALFTCMEKLRNADYSQQVMKSLIQHVRGNEIDKQWKNLFLSQLTILKMHHKTMSQTTEQEKQIYTMMDVCIKEISQAHEQYINQMTSSHTAQQKLSAAQNLFDHCENAIGAVKKHLNKGSHYKILSLLSDILNTVILIATLGVSYLVSGKFRLFSPSKTNMDIAKQMVDTSDQTIQVGRLKSLDLFVSETEISLSI